MQQYFADCIAKQALLHPTTLPFLFTSSADGQQTFKSTSQEATPHPTPPRLASSNRASWSHPPGSDHRSATGRRRIQVSFQPLLLVAPLLALYSVASHCNHQWDSGHVHHCQSYNPACPRFFLTTSLARTTSFHFQDASHHLLVFAAPHRQVSLAIHFPHSCSLEWVEPHLQQITRDE